MSWLALVGVGVLLLAPATPALAAKGKSVTSAQIKALTKKISQGKHITYEAVYQASENGQNTTVTIAQAPPKSNFSTSGASVVDTGTTTYICSGAGAAEHCLSAGIGNPLAALENVFSPSVVLSAFSAARAELVARHSGIKVSSLSATFGGQASTCVTVTGKGQTGKYCVTKKGILAYVGGAGGNYFELTRYSGSPPASLFAPPSGTTITLPGGVTIP